MRTYAFQNVLPVGVEAKTKNKIKNDSSGAKVYACKKEEALRVVKRCNIHYQRPFEKSRRKKGKSFISAETLI